MKKIKKFTFKDIWKKMHLPQAFEASFSVKLALLAVIYIITGKSGLQFAAVSGFAAPFWFPSAISLTALYLWGYRLWPSVFLGALFVNLLTGAPFFSAVGIGIGNTLEAVLGVYILNRLEFNRSFERVRNVFALMLASGPISAVVSATIGLISLWLGQAINPSMLASAWSTWFIGDLLSFMIVAPVLLNWSSKFFWNAKDKEKFLEGLILTFIILIFSVFIFTRPLESPPIAYAIFPPLLWAALRFSPRFVITQVFFISLLAIWNTSHHMGPFAEASLSEGLFYLQLYLGVVGASSLIFSAVMSERNQLESRKDDFLSMASHELKTPVTSIKIYSDILRKHLESSEDKKITKVVSNIAGQTDRLKELVSDLLDVSRIEAGKLKFVMEDFKIDELIEEVKSGLQPSTYKHDIVYKTKPRVIVYADKYRVYQVVVNLLTNAIKYSPEGGDIIIKVLKEKEKVLLSIRDYGIGVDEDQKEKIFDRLYQAGGAKEKTYPGLGMGLFISKEIIKRHKGEIWVESEKGKGSTFYFTLPTRRKRISLNK
jgi:signal transduction histidine kinase